MANRHLSRSIVMQSLFERDFNNLHVTDMPKIIDRNVLEFAPGITDRSFIETLANNVLSKQQVLDDIIVKAAPEWPLEKISVVDRNILRLGLYELLFTSKKEVPSRVAINESIELAKTFGGESSGRFVNGVLGTVYREMGGPESEPEEDRVVKKKKKPGQNKVSDFEPDELAQMPIEKVAGGVVYVREGADVYLALVHDIFGYWTLSKGHMEEGETTDVTAVRKIKEETEIDAEVEQPLGSNEYIANDPKLGKVRRQVEYFLMRAANKSTPNVHSSGLDDARWFELQEIDDLKIYDDILPLITKAITLIFKKQS
ncbi:MAG: transcription antitermination factor NusB [Parcubacteria group bacterium RIFOXYD2_FULL_52_8]|nr:MAG: transcription antitermination factor NusB [Parcubacteria group bacterium RIFOXYD2_FULL_52_8]